MKVELLIRNLDFVVFQSSYNCTEGTATSLKFFGRVACNYNLIVERRGVNLSDSLVSDGGDIGMMLEFFNNFMHDFFGLGDF